MNSKSVDQSDKSERSESSAKVKNPQQQDKNFGAKPGERSDKRHASRGEADESKSFDKKDDMDKDDMEKKDVESERHLGERNVETNEFMKKDKKHQTETPKDRRY